jgi:hypothetical protein
MKRFLLHVTISILAFCFGLGVNRILTTESRANIAPLQAEPQHLKSIIIETPAVPAASVAAPPVHVIADYDVNKFYPEADYSFTGRKPKDFDEFSYLSLGRFVDVNGNPTGQIQLGTFSNDNYESHEAILGLITEKRLFFVTAQSSKEQFQYWFDGVFVIEKSGTYLIKGKLTKTKNGCKVAEHAVTLRAEEHAC